MDKETQRCAYPPLPLEEWEETKNILHLYIQVVGKIRLALFPKMNHWWHATLYLSTRGLTTRTIPYQDRLFEIEFDFIYHVLSIKTSKGEHEQIELNGMSVSQFYREVFDTLSKLGIDVKILALPYDNISKVPFENNHTDVRYDKEYVNRFWQVLVLVSLVFEKFRAEYTGKSSPVHLFWHHLDLVVTRFSGKRAPDKQWPTNVEREAYSHEVISFGFWAGDDVVREAAFYAYMYPEPEALMDQRLEPEAAVWSNAPGYAMAFLPYEAVRQSSDPGSAVMSFLESVYQAGTSCGGWDVKSTAL
ncbi:Ava_C0101 and related proteins [hydrothermal vent metagenome]|uniref:Ava_C0101 and related proteins n=1 Tax=hydrothermal vent metagenome TaxID=652676 RepID=A0A3B0Z425_9ZZZZ